MLLARTVANTTDVNGMLAAMEPSQFDEWWVMWRLQPWGIEPRIDDENNTDSLSAFQRQAGF